MSGKRPVEFAGGRNIAMKVPPHQWEETIRFYRDVIGLEVLDDDSPSFVFEFGANRLWIDRVGGMSQAEVWLELTTDDVPAADGYFESEAVIRRDEIEPLPQSLEGFWISNPASIIHLVRDEREPGSEEA
ncbi:MAG: hypothetical protein ACRDSJ_23890 [Rubrobacteraceae bacterium]